MSPLDYPSVVSCVCAVPPPSPQAPIHSPSIFSLLKWKSDEHDQSEEGGLRWRDIVSFKNHPLQGWSRLISRSLQLLCSAVSAKKQNLGFATMLGVRDQIGALGRVGGEANSSEFCELDMDNMFWEIPQHEAIQSVAWAFDACRKGKNDPWFSLARGGEKALDRIGKSSSSFWLVRRQSAGLLNSTQS